MISDENCDHEPCSCTVGQDGGIKDEQGLHYCSQSCADGEGCTCPSCGCSMESVDGSASPAPML